MTTIQEDNLCNVSDLMLMTDNAVFVVHKAFFFFLADNTFFFMVFIDVTCLVQSHGRWSDLLHTGLSVKPLTSEDLTNAQSDAENICSMLPEQHHTKRSPSNKRPSVMVSVCKTSFGAFIFKHIHALQIARKPTCLPVAIFYTALSVLL